MGILDELHIKVEEIQAEQLKRDSMLEAQEEFYREHLRPVMVQALQYLSDIVQKLNVVAPEIKPSYPLYPKTNQFVTLDQAGYKIDFDSRTCPQQIDVSCVCALAQPQEFYVPGKDAAQRHTDLLHSYSFPHQSKNHLDKRFEVRGATFYLEGPMRVHIRIRANAADGCVNVVLRNVEEQPVKRYRFTPGDFNADLLERLALLLVREETKLMEVVVNQDYRDRLRLQLEADLARAFADLESQKIEVENAKLINRVKRVVAERVGVAMRLSKQFKKIAHLFHHYVCRPSVIKAVMNKGAEGK